MSRIFRHSSYLVVLWMLLAPSTSCIHEEDDDDSAAAAPNRAPVITSLTADPRSVPPDQTSTLTAVASDLDGDALNYDWSATRGTISGGGPVVTWTAPGPEQPAGDVLVTLAVDDGRLNAEATVTLTLAGSPNGWLQGPYSLVAFEHDVFDSGAHIAVTGTLTFDGAGGYTTAMTVNNGGVIEPPTPGSGTYGVASDGALTVDDGWGATLWGGLDQAQAAVIMARVTPGKNPMIAIAVKRSGTYTQASLSGEYHLAGYQWEPDDQVPGTGDDAAFTGVSAFDPVAGTWSYSFVYNKGGALEEHVGSMNYSVTPDGSVLITGGGNEFSGGVMVGGDVMVAALTAVGNPPMIMVAVRKSGTFTSATMAGAHRTVSIGTSGSGTSSATGTRVFDGVVGWTADWTVNNNGVVAPSSTTGTYAVTPEGRLSLWSGPTEFLLGVREGGQTATGAIVAVGEAPRFVFSVRR